MFKGKSKEYKLAVQQTRDEELCIKWKDLDDEFSSTSTASKEPSKSDGKSAKESSKTADKKRASIDSIKAAASKRKAIRDFEDEDTEETIQPYPKSETEQEEIKKAIKHNEFLQTMLLNDEAVIKEMVDAMFLVSINAGDVVTKQREKGDRMFASKSGEFEIEINGNQVETFTEKRVFGELALIYDCPRTATIKALKPGEVWVLKRNIFKKIQRKVAQNDQKDILKFLRQVPEINKASDNKLKQIAQLCERVFYQRNTDIIRQGQPGNEFFIVRSGSATVSMAGKGKISTYSRGNFFGERALLTEDVRQATVTAGPKGVECLVLSRLTFNNFLGNLEVFLKQAETIRKTIDHVESMAHLDEKFSSIKLEDLEQIKRLGGGSFGVVHLVQHRQTKQKLALKMIDCKLVKSESIRIKSVYNERDIQIACDSIFITRLYVTYKDHANFYFLLEYCPRGELYTLLMKKKHFSESFAKFVAACVLEALIYLHDRNFLYLDLKPENIFIDLDGYAKLGDFGNALKLKHGESTFLFAGTPEYMAPEIIRSCGYDRSADYWAFGILIFEMLLGKTPFFANGDEGRTFDLINRGLQSKHFPPGFDKSAVGIISSLCDKNPAKRLGYLMGGPAAIRKHNWFAKFNFPELRSKALKSPLLSLYKK